MAEYINGECVTRKHLSKGDRERIRNRLHSYYWSRQRNSPTALAAEYGVSAQTIYNIWHRGRSR